MSTHKKTSEPKLVTLALDKLELKGGTQPRKELDPEVVKEYAGAYRAGVAMPPVRAFWDGEAYWLVDGFHRVKALRRNHETSARVEIHEGTLKEAIRFAAGANKSHGLRRTNEDKKNAVEMAVAIAVTMSPQPSSRQIADHVGVDHKTVEKYRVVAAKDAAVNWGNSPVDEERAGRDGRRRRKAQVTSKASSGSDGEEAPDPDDDGEVSDEGEDLESQVPPGPVFDQVGQEVTDPDIAEAFTILAPMLREVAKRVRSGSLFWGPFHEQQLAAKHLRILRARSYGDVRPKVEEKVKQLAYSIRSEEPYAICPYCHGAPCPEDITQRCEGCGGGGWVDKSGYENAPLEMKALPPRKPARGSASEATHA